MTIGIFNKAKIIVVKTGMVINLLKINMIFLCLIVTLLMLKCGDVEVNPGPPNKTLSMCHINIRSLSVAKLRAIECNLSKLFDVITLSETHLHPNVTSDAMKLPGFHEILRKDRVGQGGGVAIYVKENLAYKRMFNYERVDMEAIWIQLNTIEGKILVCSAYRPPDKAGGPAPFVFWDN